MSRDEVVVLEVYVPRHGVTCYKPGIWHCECPIRPLRILVLAHEVWDGSV